MDRTKDYFYHLPPGHIAQRPIDNRDASRLLLLNRSNESIQHRHFADLPDLLNPGDILVANNSRVIPARILGRKKQGGGRVELLLLEALDDTSWRVLVGGRRIVPGTEIALESRSGEPTDFMATVKSDLGGPQRLASFNASAEEILPFLGHTPLPPYIHEPLNDPERYQTIYSRPPGSAAAPTAGLHFTGDLLLALRAKGVLFETITLHVGLDTFKPVDAEFVVDHKIHSEWAQLSPETAQRINNAKLAGGRLIAVGTTCVRVLETAALISAGLSGSFQEISRRDAAGETTGFCPWRPIAAFENRTDLFIYPGYHFRVVDALITNFHLPESSLLMLVSAFAGRELILSTYAEAIKENYRFYSFGDAMFIT